MRVLGLDLGLTTGQALVKDGKLIGHGEWKLGDDKVQRLFTFADHLAHEFEYGVDLLVYEGVAFSKGKAWGKLYSQLETIIIMEAAARQIPVKAVPVGTLKKWATGDHKASKNDMIKAARELLPYEGVVLIDMTDNEADAICLAFNGYEEAA